MLQTIKPYDHGNISIYIHWPFCNKKCPYCDFNSYVTANIDHEKWLQAYLKRIKNLCHILKNKKIKSIFFGGGTPSLMKPEAVAIMIEIFQNHNKTINSTETDISEITLEANPTTFDSKKFKDFRNAGVNRLSIGVQSFNDNVLKTLKRDHNSKQAEFALRTANTIFNNVSFDIMFGIPNQQLSDLARELEYMETFFKTHVSIYQLTIEPNTQFFRDKVLPADEDTATKMYELIIKKMEDNNFNQYEISNFASPNNQCIHNLNYWRGGEYIGIGPGAHGRLFQEANWIATMEQKNPYTWIDNLLTGSDTHTNHQQLTNMERLMEITLTQLRLNEPIPSIIVDKISKEKLQKLHEEGLLESNNKILQITTKGRYCLNYLIGEIVDNF